jgi:hypothetical protein
MDIVPAPGIVHIPALPPLFQQRIYATLIARCKNDGKKKRKNRDAFHSKIVNWEHIF